LTYGTGAHNGLDIFVDAWPAERGRETG